MSDDAGEKTLAPTEKRLTEAAKNGDVLRSRELAVATSMLVGAAFLKMGGPWLIEALGETLRSGLTWNHDSIDNFNPTGLMTRLLIKLLPPIAILGLTVSLASVVAQLGPAGHGRFFIENIAPKPSKLNPMNGLKRIFGMNGWIEVGKGLVKVALLGTIGYVWAKTRVAGMMQLSAVSLSGQLAFAWDAITTLLFRLTGGLVVIALIDFPLQWFQRRRRLMMSLQEVRDENKQAEGSPEAKGHRRNRQRQIAMNSIAASMRKAQCIITNPTHFAVAMTYDPDLAPAPVVLAKGRGDKAMAMREMAAELGLPCLEIPSLARSVYYTTRERQMIREELYGAVAGVLAFVLSIKRGEARTLPPIEVPVALRFDADGRPDPGDAQETP